MVTVTMKSGYLEEIMTDEVREYAERKIWESGIRMVPGHYPEFENKEQVDDWLYISEYMFIKSFGQEMPEIISVDIQGLSLIHI